jgi:hypothetical protein
MIGEPQERGDWWNFERLSPWDPTHPAAAWAAHLLQEAALTVLPCPRCGRAASVRTNLDHLLREHRGTYAEAAAWLEDADPDLFALAVHYLATKARTSRRPASRRSEPGHVPQACAVPAPGGQRSRGRGVLPGWCRQSVSG